jgi:hypothetical protein
LYEPSSVGKGLNCVVAEGCLALMLTMASPPVQSLDLLPKSHLNRLPTISLGERWQ